MTIVIWQFRGMSDDILNTIELLTKRVGAKEEEANKLKKLVNELCAEVGVAVRYPNIAESSASISAIRSDQFYGQTLTAAIRNYLEQHKASNLGAAGVQEIYLAIRDGGYKFETKNEDNAKVSVGNALRKTSPIFHRLPNGQYGLLAWYPSAKAKPEPDSSPKKEAKKAHSGGQKSAADDSPPAAKNLVTNKEIRDVILAQGGEFQGIEIESAIKAKFPTKHLPKTKIPTVVFILKRKGLIKEVSPKSGSRPAVYAKI
jgi:hypothetical protein